MTDKYRAAIIGCGRISHPHATAFSAVQAVDLVAAADPNERARLSFGERYGIDLLYADAAEMMAAARPDLVAICTWPDTHADLTEIACAAGARAVICEKPMAVDLADADRMLEAAAASATVLLVNHQRRFAWRYETARRLIDEGAIGRVTQITGTCNSDMLTSGTHTIDMIRFLAGDRPIAAVLGSIDMSPRADLVCLAPEFAQKGTFYGHHMESASFAQLVFDDGSRALCEAGKIARPGYVRIVVDGVDGRLEVDGDPDPWRGELPPLRYLSAGKDWAEPMPPEHRSDEMTLSLEALLDTLETGERHPLDGSSGRADLEVITAIFQSARGRELVNLPCDCLRSPLEEMVKAKEIPLNVSEAVRRLHELDEEESAADVTVDDVSRCLVRAHSPLPGSWEELEFMPLPVYREWYGSTLTETQYRAVERFVDTVEGKRRKSE